MALGFVLHDEGGGTLWNILERGGEFVLLRRGRRGREDAEGAEKMWRRDERQGAKGAKGRAPRGGWVLWAHVGPPIGPGVVRGWDHFCAPKIKKWGFARELWG